jgi:hypothetical protein
VTSYVNKMTFLLVIQTFNKKFNTIKKSKRKIINLERRTTVLKRRLGANVKLSAKLNHRYKASSLTRTWSERKKKF